MKKTIWQAFYYDSLDGMQAPLRSELLEADSECAALALARQRAGQAKRIEVASPRWAAHQTRAVQAATEMTRSA